MQLYWAKERFAIGVRSHKWNKFELQNKEIISYNNNKPTTCYKTKNTSCRSGIQKCGSEAEGIQYQTRPWISGTKNILEGLSRT